MLEKTKQFRKKLEKLSREDLLEIIQSQNPEYIKQINRIEWVFRNKLSHLTWQDGSRILERPMSRSELSLLIEEPFEIDNSLLSAGISSEIQKQIHIAKDPCTWSKNFLRSRN
jgi:hypothetical protein